MTSTEKDFALECFDIFEDIGKCLNYLICDCKHKADRLRFDAFLNECIAFNDIKDVLIDRETGKFTTAESLETVVGTIQHAAEVVFGDKFPMLRWKALDLSLRLMKVGRSECLYSNDNDAPLIH